MNKLTELTVLNGKTLKKSQLNLLAKLDKLGVRIPAPGSNLERANPYSGIKHTLDPVAAALYDFIIDQYHGGMVGKLFPVAVWDSARYLFLFAWPNQYYDLID